MKFQDTFFNFSANTYTQNGLITLDKLCNGVNIVNTGTTVCQINGIPLNPPGAGQSVGDSYSVGGNKGEILSQRVQISFAGGSGKAVVVQKFYLDKCD